MKPLFLAALACLPSFLRAQYTVPADREGLLKGEGMGLAIYAERNGFPGPRHVLILKDTLGLTIDQERKTSALLEGIQASSKLLGEQIVRLEEQLNILFVDKTGAGNPSMVQSTLREIGSLRADLRFTHLQAHLGMRKVLTPGQIHLYSVLRGYEAFKK